MLSKGKRDIGTLFSLEHRLFILCRDADGNDPGQVHDEVSEKVASAAGLGPEACVVVPVQEIEAWILADLTCANKLFRSWRPDALSNPESIRNPKEYLRRLSRADKAKPRYTPAIHNQQMAKHLDLDVVSKKCPSFRPLKDFVDLHRAILGPA